jgi:hypothetical protein
MHKDVTVFTSLFYTFNSMSRYIYIHGKQEKRYNENVRNTIEDSLG